jgi:hypothetical protein
MKHDCNKCRYYRLYISFSGIPVMTCYHAIDTGNAIIIGKYECSGYNPISDEEWAKMSAHRIIDATKKIMKEVQA